MFITPTTGLLAKPLPTSATSLSSLTSGATTNFQRAAAGLQSLQRGGVANVVRDIMGGSATFYSGISVIAELPKALGLVHGRVPRRDITKAKAGFLLAAIKLLHADSKRFKINFGNSLNKRCTQISDELVSTAKKDWPKVDDVKPDAKRVQAAFNYLFFKQFTTSKKVFLEALRKHYSGNKVEGMPIEKVYGLLTTGTDVIWHAFEDLLHDGNSWLLPLVYQTIGSEYGESIALPRVQVELRGKFKTGLVTSLMQVSSLLTDPNSGQIISEIKRHNPEIAQIRDKAEQMSAIWAVHILQSKISSSPQERVAEEFVDKLRSMFPDDVYGIDTMVVARALLLLRDTHLLENKIVAKICEKSPWLGRLMINVYLKLDIDATLPQTYPVLVHGTHEGRTVRHLMVLTTVIGSAAFDKTRGDIRVSGKDVAERHLQIEKTVDGNFHAHPLSRNETLQVMRDLDIIEVAYGQEFQLEDGDIIVAGNEKLHFFMPDTNLFNLVRKVAEAYKEEGDGEDI